MCIRDRPLDNLDHNEFQAVIDDMGMAISQHLPRLSLPPPAAN